MSEPVQSVRVSNQELATVREAMRQLHRLLASLEHGELEKVVLTQRNQMRAVLITLERYSERARATRGVAERAITTVARLSSSPPRWPARSCSSSDSAASGRAKRCARTAWS